MPLNLNPATVERVAQYQVGREARVDLVRGSAGPDGDANANGRINV